jgi:peroxiredoxin Q/BCP
MVTLHEKAPTFCLLDQNKESLCLEDFQGKWVVLYFYPKDNTPGCTLEAINFTHREEEFKKYNAVIIGISPDSCESHKKFEKKHKLTVALLSDLDHKVLELYEVWKPKKLYGRDFFGVIRSTFLISQDGLITFIWNRVNVPGHIEAVLNKLKELQA